MNKRQWKKYRKKKRLEWEETKKRIAINKWESNIVFQNIADQIINGKIIDCGIRIERKTKFKSRKLGEIRK